ncbi:MAG: hypothetical protein ACI8QZ_001303 [Chlamydiales bacterium]
MKYDILSKPSYAVVEVHLEQGETIVSDSGAMAWMDTTISTQTSTRGGALAGLKRKFLAGESLFQNTYTATAGAGTIAFAGGAAGDLVAIDMQDGELLLEKGAYLASSDGIKADSKWSGLKGFFNEGLFILRCTGTGTLFFNAYGDIQEIDVDGEYLVDNGYAVAWDPSLQYQLTRARRIRSFLFGDQIMLRFSGRGKLWVQSRSAQSLANWVHPFRRVQRRNN